MAEQQLKIRVHSTAAVAIANDGDWYELVTDLSKAHLIVKDVPMTAANVKDLTECSNPVGPSHTALRTYLEALREGSHKHLMHILVVPVETSDTLLDQIQRLILPTRIRLCKAKDVPFTAKGLIKDSSTLHAMVGSLEKAVVVLKKMNVCRTASQFVSKVAGPSTLYNETRKLVPMIIVIEELYTDLIEQGRQVVATFPNAHTNNDQRCTVWKENDTLDNIKYKNPVVVIAAHDPAGVVKDRLKVDSIVEKCKLYNVPFLIVVDMKDTGSKEILNSVYHNRWIPTYHSQRKFITPPKLATWIYIAISRLNSDPTFYQQSRGGGGDELHVLLTAVNTSIKDLKITNEMAKEMITAK